MVFWAAAAWAEPVAPSPAMGSWGAATRRGINTYGSFTDDDFATLQTWGVDHVRHQLVTAKVVDGPDGPTLDERAWTNLDETIGLARAHGLQVVIDSHHHSEFYPDKLWEPAALAAWQDPARAARLAGLWRTIAARYRDNRETVCGYEILNEPHPYRSAEGYAAWSSVAATVTAAIREVDGWHTIVVDGPEYAKPGRLLDLTPTGDPNTVYSVHLYDPSELTHQGIEWMHAPFGQVYPGIIPLGWDEKTPTRVDRDWLAERFAPAVEFQRRHGVRIWVGEFSCRRFAPDNSAFRWLRDVVDLMEERGWDWCYHCYRGDRYGDTQWSLEQTSDQSDTARHDHTHRLDLLRSRWQLRAGQGKETAPP